VQETQSNNEPEIRTALERLLASPEFAGKRRGELLRYLVEKTLARDGEITEYGIALDVFRKPESFDPAAKSTVRAEMNRMRKALAEYYAAPGAEEPVRIEFALREYAPAFVVRPPEPAPVRKRRWPWIAGAVVLALLISAAWKWLMPGKPPIRSVIVLPFANLTGDPANDYLADGLTESLTDSLAHISSLRVVARTSAFQFRGKAGDIRKIGRAVNADAVVEGSLRSTEGRLRVTVQLNRAADGYHILSRVFEGGPHDVIRLEGDMAPPVLAALRPDFHLATGPHVPDAEARTLVLQAKALRGYGAKEKFEKAVTLLTQAIQKDPEYAGAYAELSTVYAGATTNGFVDPVGGAEKAKAAAARALALDPASAEARVNEGYLDAMIFLQWKNGEEEIRAASTLMPQSALIHQRLGLVLMAQGSFDGALVETRRAADLDPLIPASAISVGMVLFMQRRYADARGEWTRLVSLTPEAPVLHSLIGMALEAEGDYPGAENQYRAAAPADPLGYDLRMAHLMAVSDRKAESRKLLARLTTEHPELPFDYAAAYGALGDRDRAFQWLEQVWQRRICYLLKIHPFLDPLRADPRFAVYLKRAGLAE
jgi:TolB-like protein/Flp pilus assembly protein TadD